MKKPLKEMLEKIGGKHLLNEDKAIVGFSKEMGRLYVSVGKNTVALTKKDVANIMKYFNKVKKDLD